MSTSEVKRLSAQRDEIYDYMCSRFQQLVAAGDNDSALALADEFYEWLDPHQCDDEPTHYYDERELQELFLQLTDG